MSTTSTIITIIICFLIVAAIGFALVKGIWSAAKKITVPIQIALFVVMLFCVVRLFCTKENAQKLYQGVEQTGISQNVENTVRAALNLKPAETPRPETKTATVVTNSKESAPVAAPDSAPAVSVVTNSTPKVESPKPAVVQDSPAVKTNSQPAIAPAAAKAKTEVKETPAPQVVAVPETAPVKPRDYSHLNKGKKNFTYALPFNAKVTVGFKDNTYRVIVESLGRLDASEKKEIGKLILTSLGKYVGHEILKLDKHKISIESCYDESDDRTRVYAIVPPNAVID